MKISRNFLLPLFLLLAQCAWSQNSQSAMVNIYLDGVEEAKIGSTITLVIEVEPKADWKVYSSLPSEEGAYRPAEVGWEIASRGFEAGEKLSEEGYMKVEMDDVMGGVVRYYKQKVVFKFPLKVTEEQVKVAGYFDYMACNEYQCIPFTADFELEAKVKAQ